MDDIEALFIRLVDGLFWCCGMKRKDEPLSPLIMSRETSETLTDDEVKPKNINRISP